MSPPAAQPRSRLRLAIRFGVRIALTVLVFAFLFSRIDASSVASSVARISPLALLSSIALLAGAVLLNVVRWRALLGAYGAHSLPSSGEATRLVMIGLFYNLLPGAVGGDVLRGYAARHYFADASATRSVGVVFVERVFGFAGLLILTAFATVVSPFGDRQVLVYSMLGLCGAMAAVVGVALGRRLSGYLPARLAKLAGSLPVLERPGPYALSLVLSVLTHLCVSMSGHVLLRSLTETVTLADSLTVFPIGTLASYFPLTVAGAGARDTALVVLFAKLGVAREDALATSLCMLACNLLLSGLGGLLQLRGRLVSGLPVEAPGRDMQDT